jgi:hypothetical protein
MVEACLTSCLEVVLNGEGVLMVLLLRCVELSGDRPVDGAAVW